MRATRAASATTVIALLLSAGWMACGGDDSMSGTGGPDGGSDATTDRGQDTSPGVDTGTNTDTGTGDDTGTNGDTGTGGDTGTSDAGADAAADVALIPDSSQTVTDAGPGGDAAVVSCGSASCSLPAQTCCIYPEDASFQVACSTGASCPVLFTVDAGAGGDAGTGISATALQCEVKENCPANNVCCIVKDPSGSISSHCTTSCQGGVKNAELCDPAAADAGCGDAGACSSNNVSTWNLPSGFATCGGKSAN